MKRFYTALTFSLFFSLLAGAFAQQTFKGIVAGDALGWESHTLGLTLELRETTTLDLSIFSPGFDPDDYRGRLEGRTEVGDERYDSSEGEVAARFSLTNATTGEVVAEKRYGVEAHRQDVLFRGTLEPGSYTLGSEFFGLAKNAFVYTLDAPEGAVTLFVEPDQFLVDPRPGVDSEGDNAVNYTISRGDWNQPFSIEVPDDLPVTSRPVRVGIYDADGPSELMFRLRQPSGDLREMPVSGDLEWYDYDLTTSGRYDFTFRIPDAAYQYSNTIGLRVDKRLQVDGDVLRVVLPPRFDLSKTVTPEVARPGDTVTYTITAKNVGGMFGAATLSDELPPGLAGEGLNEALELFPGESRTFNLSATVTEDAPDTVTNTATLTNLSMLGAAPLRASADLTVLRGEASFSLTKTV